MKRKFLYLLLLFSSATFAQPITIEMCHEKARDKYPLIKQQGLIDKLQGFSIANANKAYLPQLSLLARATYQSDAIDITIGQMHLKQDKDQYQAIIEASQTLWDGGMVKAQKKSILAQSEADKQKLEVDLYAVKERVNQLYFGIMLQNEQLKQIALLTNELIENQKRVEALKQNGIASASDVNNIKVEILNSQQRKAEITSSRKSFIYMLAVLTGIKIDESTIFERPIVPSISTSKEIKRPELNYFDAQYQFIESQKEGINATVMPKINLFAQGGIGKPGMNMLSNDFTPFYIGGIRLAWNFSQLYSLKNNLNKIDLNKKIVDVQKETFLFNNHLVNSQLLNEIERQKQLLKTDDEIIELRNSIKKSSETKVQNGTATITDLLREINAENTARLTKAMHEIQLYLSVYQQKNATNY